MKEERRDFTKSALAEEHLAGHPIAQFEQWLDEATADELTDATAMTLSTFQENQPSARIVYLRGMEGEVLRFFTNYNSQKGHEIATNPKVSLLFFWPQLERQVRITGVCKKSDAAVSDEYFNSRPRESKIGAWASDQSSPIESREALEQKVEDIAAKFEGKEVTRPPHWGGYDIQPDSFEFWQGRESRLHDRVKYEKKDGKWQYSRLSP